MKKKSGLFLFLLLFSVPFLFSACAGAPTWAKFPEPGQKFVSSAEKSLVFGQFEVINDGYPLPLNLSSFHISPLGPYLNNEASVFHSIIDIDPKTGYFVGALLPGKYAITDIIYRPGWGTGFRDMMRKVCAGCRYDILRKPSPILPIVEVLPGKATYTGTMQAITDSYLNVIRWEIKSKNKEAWDLFSTLYPDHPEPVERLMEIKPCNMIISYFGPPLCLPIEDK